MRRSLAWLTATLTLVAVTAAVSLRPLPLPGAPPPIRLEGEAQLESTPAGGLQVVPPVTVRLGADDSNGSTESPDDTRPSTETPDGDDSTGTDSVDSPDD